MALKDLLQFFVPKDKTFFPLFEDASAKLILLSETLHEAVNIKGDRVEYYDKIERLVADIEKLTHSMNLELSRNFITPLDREDIHALITSMNEVANYIYTGSNRMRLYQVENITKSIRKLTEINLECSQMIASAVGVLEHMGNLNTINVAVKKINKLQEKADVVFDKAVADLFENETDVKNIIKYKEVLSSLHNSTDKCRVVGRVLEAISVKHA